MKEHLYNSWKRAGNGRGSRKLINQFDKWMDCGHRDAKFYFTLFLSGHGIFHAYLYETYLYRMKRSERSTCLHCTSSGNDDVFHTFFVSERWNDERGKLEDIVLHVTPII